MGFYYLKIIKTNSLFFAVHSLVFIKRSWEVQIRRLLKEAEKPNEDDFWRHWRKGELIADN